MGSNFVCFVPFVVLYSESGARSAPYKNSELGAFAPLRENSDSESL